MNKIIRSGVRNGVRVAVMGGGCVLLLFALSTFVASAQNQVANMRGDAELNQAQKPQPIPKIIDSTLRKVRNYPEQPPLIPHKIDNYQIDLNANKCLECHRRTAIGETGAPMISVTHYMDRQNQVLAVVSPRRYFCTQCHVTQHDTKEIVGNEFVDAEEIIKFLGEQQTQGSE